MSTVKDIYSFLDGLYPRTLSCEWDNDGLMVCRNSEREVKKVLLEEFLPQMTCELLLHLNFFNRVIKDDKQSSGLVEKATDLLASNHMALFMLTTLAGLLGGEGTIDQMMESVVDLFRVKGKEERQRMKELIRGYTVVPIKKE